MHDDFTANRSLSMQAVEGVYNELSEYVGNISCGSMGLHRQLMILSIVLLK